MALPAAAAAAMEFGITQHGALGLAVEPLQVLSARCQAGRVWRAALRLRWKAAANLREVEVRSTGPGDATSTLFARSGPSGQADTGEWVQDGQRFEFIDAATGNSLGSIALAAPACAP